MPLARPIPVPGISNCAQKGQVSPTLPEAGHLAKNGSAPLATVVFREAIDGLANHFDGLIGMDA